MNRLHKVSLNECTCLQKVYIVGMSWYNCFMIKISVTLIISVQCHRRSTALSLFFKPRHWAQFNNIDLRCHVTHKSNHMGTRKNTQSDHTHTYGHARSATAGWSCVTTVHMVGCALFCSIVRRAAEERGGPVRTPTALCYCGGVEPAPQPHCSD